MIDEQKKLEILEKANIPQEWREHCYVTESEMIFTPRFDEEGVMLVDGEQSYKEWIEQKENPIEAEPTTDEKVVLLEQQLADLEIAQLL